MVMRLPFQCYTSPMVVLVCAVLAVLGLSGCQKPASNPQAMAGFSVPVTYLKMTPQAVDEGEGYLAQVTSDTSVWVKSQLEGRIQKVLVQDGAYVAQGTPLFVLDASQAQAQLEAAQAATESAMHDAQQNEATLGVIASEKQALEADLAYQAKQLERYRVLKSSETTSQQQLDQAETTVAQLTEKSQALTSQYQAQQARVQQVRSQLKQYQAQAKALSVHLGWHTIKAPFSGTIGEVKAKLGEVVATDTPLAELVQGNHPVELEVRLPLSVASKVRRGTPLTITHLDGTPAAQATVVFKAPRLDPDTQTFLVKARLPQGTLQIDEKLKARLSFGTQQALMVPAPAVVRMTGATFVYVITPAKQSTQPDKAHLQPVVLGSMQAGAYPVVKGLNVGDVIVTAGVQKLQGAGDVMDASKMPVPPSSASPHASEGGH